MEPYDPFDPLDPAAPKPEAPHSRNTISTGTQAPVTRHTVSVLVQNQPGVLSRVSGLCSRRGFDIDSLAVGPTQNEDVSRITLTLQGDAAHIEQLVQQLYKLIVVQKVIVLDPRRSVERQLVLCKIRAGAAERDAVMRIVDIFRARIVDVARTTLTIELTGEEDKAQAMLGLLADYDILEIVRTGTVALQRGESTIAGGIWN